MLIVIDLGGDGEEEDIVGKKAGEEAQRLDEERRQKEAWMEWVRWNEQVVPQVVPVIND